MEKRIKKSIICAGINAFQIETERIDTYLPTAGDVGIFEVLSIGKHTQIQSDNKCNRYIYPGDYIMAAFGTRYATEQFEGYVPGQIEPEYHILGAGGTVGIIKSMHAKFNNVGPTRLKLVGYAVNKSGAILNTKREKAAEAKTFSGVMQSLTRVVLSVGSSMDSGKTTTAAHLVRGLKKAGMRVGFIKLTGTVYTKDRDLAYDNGADVVTDFGEMGFPSTYMCQEQELLDLYESLLTSINAHELEYVVVEIADGIYQRETSMLLTNSRFMTGVDAVVFSAGDSLAAVQGVKALQDMHIIPAALSGLFTASPLLMEEVKARTCVPVYTIGQLADGAATHFLEEPLNMTA
jgi:hypothetical protein